MCCRFVTISKQNSHRNEKSDYSRQGHNISRTSASWWNQLILIHSSPPPLPHSLSHSLSLSLPLLIRSKNVIHYTWYYELYGNLMLGSENKPTSGPGLSLLLGLCLGLCWYSAPLSKSNGSPNFDGSLSHHFPYQDWTIKDAYVMWIMIDGGRWIKIGRETNKESKRERERELI